MRVWTASLKSRDRRAPADPAGWRKDKAIIHIADVAGEIDAVDPGVETWSTSERVITFYFQ